MFDRLCLEIRLEHVSSFLSNNMKHKHMCVHVHTHTTEVEGGGDMHVCTDWLNGSSISTLEGTPKLLVF